MQHSRKIFALALLLATGYSLHGAGFDLAKEVLSVPSVKIGKSWLDSRAIATIDSLQYAKGCCHQSSFGYAGSQIMAILTQNAPMRALFGSVTNVCEEDVPKVYEVINKHSRRFGMSKPQLLVNRKRGWFKPESVSVLHSLGFIILDIEDLKTLNDDALEGTIIHQLNEIRHSHGLRYLVAGVCCYVAASYAVDYVLNQAQESESKGIVGKAKDFVAEKSAWLPFGSWAQEKGLGDTLSALTDKLSTPYVLWDTGKWAGEHASATAPNMLQRAVGSMFKHKQQVSVVPSDWLKRLTAAVIATVPLAALSRRLEKEADIDGCYSDESAQKMLALAKHAKKNHDLAISEWDLVIKEIEKAQEVSNFNKGILYSIGYTMRAYRKTTSKFTDWLLHRSYGGTRVDNIVNRIDVNDSTARAA